MEGGEESRIEDSDVLGEVGRALRSKRLELRQSLSEVAEYLRIKESYLSAIEDGRGEDLPGKAYLKGFIRSYAGYLKLDVTHLRGSLELGLRSDLLSKSAPPLAPALPSQSPSGLMLLIAGLIAIGAYAAWSYLIVPPENLNLLTSDIPKELSDAVKKTEVKNPASALAAKKEKLTSVGPVNSSQGDAPSPVKASSNTVKMKAEKPSPVELMDTKNPIKRKENLTLKAGSKEKRLSEKTNPVTSMKSKKMFLPGTKFPSPTQVKRLNPEPPEGPISIRGKFASWLEVKRKNGEALISRMLLPGEIFVLPRERGILLDTGNAGGIEILLEGELVAPLGLNGSVRRNVLIEPETLEQIIKNP